MSDAHCNNLTQRKALGLVSHDNTGGPFVVECHGCGVVYPSFQCNGGGQIADTGDYEDARCPHCGHVDPEECENPGLAWNTQQLKINELQQRLTAADERADHNARVSAIAVEDVLLLQKRVDVLEGLLAKYYNRSDVCAFMAKDIGAALKPAEPHPKKRKCQNYGHAGPKCGADDCWLRNE